MTIDNQEFVTRADSTMSELLSRLDEFDPDELEADASAGVIKMTFASGGACVLNRQTAACQLWLAEGATAWHFEYAPGEDCWRDTKGRGTLVDVLGEVLSKRLGRTVRL